MDNSKKIILHLCATHGSDTLPYREAGYDVRIIGEDIGVENYTPPDNVYGIIANPPCTHFSIARTNAKTSRNLEKGMSLVKECLRIIWECQYKIKEGKRNSPLNFWAIENPATGMLKYFLGKPVFQYSPHEYGANYTKRTALWGWFNLPIRPLLISKLPPCRSIKEMINPIKMDRNFKETMQLRSDCYYSFAQAFFNANR